MIPELLKALGAMAKGIAYKNTAGRNGCNIKINVFVGQGLLTRPEAAEQFKGFEYVE